MFKVRIHIALLLLLVGTSLAMAQEDVKTKTVNFGVRAGFNSTLFIISELKMGSVSVDEVQNNYKIGSFGSVFMRINMGRHFIQPEIGYNQTRCELTFANPLYDNVTAVGSTVDVNSKINSIELPILYGYNFIKQGSYSMAFFGGPKLRHLWTGSGGLKVSSNGTYNVDEKLYPVNLSLTLGVAVTISRIFFDFRYDIGLHNISKRIVTIDETSAPLPLTASDLRFRRRENVLSFSLGLFL